ncbi:histidine phosphatase family protein [Pseudomonas sp. ANT_H14]|uniref:lipopolysaccharide core heptose(II)-phosphate phosphatase PmrG n=1 Tax=unclassified Pseudomonas TaxID=196821 RepID=UPI0011EDC4DF|nr:MULTISPECIES: histidine phosphatase family protein [unclassified Pseudomonas]KAA0945517.1 histidine phosphatase family protein [Pseudomonas sp. ANT_H4]KAA0951876.1 histidine phosphatase family protein [Pseudomonas sp. ANT_H14]
MVKSVVDLTLTKPRSRRAPVKRLKNLCLGLAFIGLLVAGVMFWPSSPLDLGVGNRLLTSGVLASWHNGDLIVLVRHEERCDRSTNPCLGPEDGLTLPGSQSASALGKAFQTLGMDSSDVLSSPATRTAQTLLFMFGKTQLSPGPLAICGDAMGEEILGHKIPGRNLLLITHSACISDFERALGFEHADAAEYGSSLFVEVSADGTLKALGIMNSQDWAAALKQL